jgi:hypothetical protein
LGLNVAKNDRHLAKIAEHYGFSSAHTLCQAISDTTGEPTSVVDIVLWRFASLCVNPQSAHRSQRSAWILSPKWCGCAP